MSNYSEIVFITTAVGLIQKMQICNMKNSDDQSSIAEKELLNVENPERLNKV